MMNQIKFTKGIRKFLEYYKGFDDYYLPFFYWLKNHYEIEKVIYPGSYIHITPSLVFPEVVYIDNTTSSKITFEDNNTWQFIKKYKMHKKNPKMRFYSKDYNSILDEKKSYFDLLISISAGFISVACVDYLKQKGLLLADNEHNDASMAFVSNKYELIGILNRPESSRHHHKTSDNRNKNQFDEKYLKMKKTQLKKHQFIEFETNNLNRYFQPKNKKKLTLEMVKEILTTSPSKLSYKLKKKADLYLFKKI